MLGHEELTRLTTLYASGRISRRQLLRALAAAGSLAALTPILAACGGGDDAPSAGGGTAGSQATAGSGQPAGGGKRGGTFTVGMSADVVTLDPPMFTDVYSNYVSSQIHEGLVWVDFTGNIAPRLAEKFERPDPTSYVFTLRQGVRFHNGEELTSDDVKYTIERLLSPELKSPRAGRLDMVKSIETPDKYTARFLLKEPFTPFLDRLAGGWAYVVNKKAVDAAAGDYTHKPVGTGPFKYGDWKTGDRATLERNDAYWGDKPLLDRVVFRPIPDQNTRLVELESGGLDYMMDVPPEEIKRLRDEKRLQVFEAPAINYSYLAYNVKKAPFQDNPKLRKALAHAINRKEINDVIYQGLGRPAITSLTPESWGHNPNVEAYAYDPSRAKALLGESGYRGGDIELSCSEDPLVRRTAERIQAQAKENLGLTVTIKALEFGGFLNYIRTGEHQMFLLAWNGSVDPDSIVFPLFATKNHGAAGNRAFYSNPQVDKLLDDAQKAPDQERRKAMYQEAQKLIADDAPHVPIRHGSATAGAQKHVQGFQMHPLQAQVYTQVSLNK
ncbi:MAG: ABC transporter substrate-binding protein [Chloroflexota bacterium]|nr:ABC transporter substrate-binding protein [Chloroflexota bacterium]